MSYTYTNIDNSVYPYRLKHMEVFFSDLSCLNITLIRETHYPNL